MQCKCEENIWQIPMVMRIGNGYRDCILKELSNV